MVSNDSADEIESVWRSTIERGQESGVAPSLFVGESDSLLDGLPALLACRDLAVARTDLTSPWVLAGGNGALWIALLHSLADSAPSSGAKRPPPMVSVYAGADAATTMAVQNVRTTGSAGRAPSALGGLPTGMISRLAPATVPGTIAPWESLPFAMIEPAQEMAEPAVTDWTAYAALFLALCILLLALIV